MLCLPWLFSPCSTDRDPLLEEASSIPSFDKEAVLEEEEREDFADISFEVANNLRKGTYVVLRSK